ncbi:hypothetical protein D5085_10865 [Ectothiorhodospiraceae bacterium BW-2]|nr:hypothetical protein D5085_10865 [Ectothiorhodospiraceae bacterium BW-2]
MHFSSGVVSGYLDTQGVFDTVYWARQQENIPIETLWSQHYLSHIKPFVQLCFDYFDSPHKKARAFAREFSYDDDSILAILDFPHLPLTNNRAEQALRHWVIFRRLSYGTRNAQGSRTLCLLASVVDTCHQRKADAWSFIAQTIACRRKGAAVPSLPGAV